MLLISKPDGIVANDILFGGGQCEDEFGRQVLLFLFRPQRASAMPTRRIHLGEVSALR